MADTLQTQALVTVAQNYAGDVVRQINRTSVALKLLAPSFSQGEGPNIAWVAEASGQIAESFAEGAVPANLGSDAQVPCLLPFGRYWAPFHVTGTAMAVAGTSRTPAGNIRLWARNMINASEALAKLMNTDLYTGAGGNAFVGLNAAIGTANNVYAGVDRTIGANSFWIPYVINSAGAALSFALIRTDLSTIKVACGYKPDLALISTNTFNKIGTLFDPQKQYVFQTGVSQIPVMGGLGQRNGGDTSIALDAGVGAIKFDGTYFVEDAFCPDNTIYYLNTRYIELQYLPTALSVAIFSSVQQALIGGLTDGIDTIPLGIMMELLAKVGDSQAAYLKCYPQMAVKRPNAFGVRSNFA